MTEVTTTLRSAYLAGPMRGIPEYNFPAFRRETAWLRGEGWTIFSPAERDEQDPEIDHAENVAGWSGSRGLDYFMAYDLKAVCEMDAVICLPGWENSQGARLETATAVEIGHPVFEIVPRRRWNLSVAKELRSVDPEYIRVVFFAQGIPDSEPERDVSQLAELMKTPPVWDSEPEDSAESDVHDYPRKQLRDFVAPTSEAQDYPPRVREEDVVHHSGKGESVIVSALPTGSEARKAVPLARGVLDYFPAALAEVARVSKAGNDKHNPGQEMHHARGKSTDHADCLLRHLVDRGKVDAETGQRHSAEVAWRALALLQQELEDDGLAPLPRGARLP